MINGLILSSLHCQMLLSGLKWFDKLTTNGLFLTLNRSWHTSDIRPTHQTVTPFALSLSKGPCTLSSSKGLSLSKGPSILSSSKGLSLSGCLRWFDRLTTNGLRLTLYGNWSMGPIRPTHQTITPFALSLSKGPCTLSSSKGLSLSKGPSILSSSKGLSLSGSLRWFDRLTTNGLFLTLNRSWNTSDIRPTHQTITPFALSLSKGPSILSSSKGLSLSGYWRWFDRLTTNGIPNARTSRYCTNGLPNTRTSRYCTNRLPNARTDRSCTNRSLVQARAAGFVNGLLLNESAL